MTVLYGINDLYNAYNAAVAAQQPCQVPPSFFQLIEGSSVDVESDICTPS